MYAIRPNIYIGRWLIKNETILGSLIYSIKTITSHDKSKILKGTYFQCIDKVNDMEHYGQYFKIEKI